MRIIGIDVPGFGVPTHAEAKDVLAGAMLRMRARRPSRARCRRRAAGRTDKPTVTLLGEMFPADPVGIGAMLEPLGLAAGPVVPTREWRELYAALDCAVVAAIHPFYTAVVREFEAAGRPIVGSAPVGVDGTAAWLEAIGDACGVAAAHDRRGQEHVASRDQGALAQTPIKGRITLSGYEGSELLVARLLIESGADVPLCRHRLPAHARGPTPTATGSRPRACSVQYRASLEQDLAAMQRIRARPRHRHHAGGAEGQGAGHPGALFHQPDLGAAADGPRRRRLARAGGQRRASATRRASTRCATSSTASASGVHRRRLGGHADATGRNSAPSAASAKLARRPTSARPRRWSDARPRPRSRRRLLGRGLRLHRDQGPAGRHRRPGRLREPAGHRRCCTTPTRCRRTNCRSSSPASARKSSASNGTEGAMQRAHRHARSRTCRRSSSPARSPR